MNKCVHHWLLDATGTGVCKHCHTARQFASGFVSPNRAPVAWRQTIGGHMAAAVAFRKRGYTREVTASLADEGGNW